jgi:hypothetical protein
LKLFERRTGLRETVVELGYFFKVLTICAKSVGGRKKETVWVGGGLVDVEITLCARLCFGRGQAGVVRATVIEKGLYLWAD